jgi:hypothetical protein
MRKPTLRESVECRERKTPARVPRTTVSEPSKWVARFLLPLVILSLAPTANATTVVINGSMEGNLPIQPGVVIQSGFDVSMPGTHPTATVTVTGTVTVTQDCDGPITIPVSGSYTISQNNNDWFPSGNQSDPSVYQGSGTATCTGHAPRATFTANVTSTDTCDNLQIRFHYRRFTPPTSSGSWSSTISIKPTCTSAPCTCH